MNSWSKLQEYYNLTDRNHSIYACATLLNPGLRKRHFTDNWTGVMASFIPIMEATCWETYKTEYLPLATPRTPEPRKKFTFRFGIYDTKATNQDEDDLLPPDEFQRYIRGTPTTVPKNDAYWSPIIGGLMKARKAPTIASIYTPLINCLVLLWPPSASESFPQLNRPYRQRGIVTEISYHLWSGDHTRTFYTPHR
jgi:hypothetical protein